MSHQSFPTYPISSVLSALLPHQSVRNILYTSILVNNIFLSLSLIALHGPAPHVVTDFIMAEEISYLVTTLFFRSQRSELSETSSTSSATSAFVV
jgi:hypothetical protein